jgi:hypothetical protein
VSTRAMVGFTEDNTFFSVYYRHCDGYPTGLGEELLEAMKETNDQDKIAEKCGLEFVTHMCAGDDYYDCGNPRFYPKLQADLDWFYVVHLDAQRELCSLTIFKTGNPYLEGGKSWRVWFSYVKYLPENHIEIMDLLEIQQSGLIQALLEFERSRQTEARV